MKKSFLFIILALQGCSLPSLPVRWQDLGDSCSIAGSGPRIDFPLEICQGIIQESQSQIEALTSPVEDCLLGAFVYVPQTPEQFGRICRVDPSIGAGCSFSEDFYSFPGNYLVVIAPDLAADETSRRIVLEHELRHRASFCLFGDADQNHEGILFQEN